MFTKENKKKKHNTHNNIGIILRKKNIEIEKMREKKIHPTNLVG